MSDDLFTELPVDPEQVEGPEGLVIRIPEGIRPVMQKHRIEVETKSYFLCTNI